MLTAALIITFVALAFGMVLVVHGTVAKNRWGINLEEVSCPRCSKLLPKVRKPRSFRESMWSGWTCSNCGVGVDKWGREAPPTQA